MKPYRLINASELQTLKQHFNQVVDAWNEEYALTPLSLQLSPAPKDYQAVNALRLHEASNDLALVEGDYLSVISQALFNADKPCFQASSQELALRLLSSLCNSEHAALRYNAHETSGWFYAGSTSLLLSFSGAHHHFSLILNPQWVYQQLPQHQKPAALDSVDAALAEHRLTLCLELGPSKLSVNHLASMQVGDILTTNHPLSMPLNLTRNNELFAQAELGQSAQHKSIVLTRSS